MKLGLGQGRCQGSQLRAANPRRRAGYSAGSRWWLATTSSEPRSTAVLFGGFGGSAAMLIRLIGSYAN